METKNRSKLYILQIYVEEGKYDQTYVLKVRTTRGSVNNQTILWYKTNQD